MAFFKHVLLLCDNKFLLKGFKDILNTKNIASTFTYRRSPCTNNDRSLYIPTAVPCIDINNEYEFICKTFDLVISLHSKQIFSKKIVTNIKCINIHPGYNPYNRGWFPQVFSINNKLPIGVTIHEMDEKIDHGKILFQEEIPLCSYDDSLSCYKKIICKELDMLDRYIEKILNNDFVSQKPRHEGNINFKKDFINLCKLDCNEVMTMGQAIDRLRSLTHGDYNNAFFIDDEGNKIYVKISLAPAQKSVSDVPETRVNHQ